LSENNKSYFFFITHKREPHIAVIKGHEDYNLLKASCSKIFSCINRLVKAGKINIKGKDVPVEFYLGGDYKVIPANFSTVW
jgi:hypothetical protein